MMALDFHQSTFDLLGIHPCISAERVAAIAVRERLCGCSFPKAIRELYSVVDVEDHFGSNWLTNYAKLGVPNEVSQGYMRVAIENQGVVGWFVKLDGTDDPPVYHNNDNWDTDFSTVNWVLCSKTFTNFIFDMASWERFDGFSSGLYLRAIDQFPDSSVIAQLRERFDEGPVTDFPDSRIRRFFTSRGLIRIASNTPELQANNLAEWTIDSDSFECLFQLTRFCCGFYDLRNKLKAVSSGVAAQANGEGVLESVRKSL